VLVPFIGVKALSLETIKGDSPGIASDKSFLPK
jgi:hypothetical protein